MNVRVAAAITLGILMPSCTSDNGPPMDVSSHHASIDIDASCVTRCGARAPSGCWCDLACTTHNDCCEDYEPTCVGSTNEPPPCAGHCGQQAAAGCWCDDNCVRFGDCCDDYETTCVEPPDPSDASCADHCGEQAPAGCQCTAACVAAGTCCDDYADQCSTGGSDPWADLQGEALRGALQSAAMTGHVGLGFNLARDHLHGARNPAIDIQNGLLECAYTGRTVAPDGTRSPGGILNTEHSWPRSDGASFYPRSTDLHHLFVTTIASNARRAALEYGTTTCSGAGCPWSNGGSEVGTNTAGTTVFEARPTVRGDLARAHFYFSVRYGIAISPAEESVLRAWHAQDPPDDRERTRNDTVESVQGNRNPFVDYPTVVQRVMNF